MNLLFGFATSFAPLLFLVGAAYVLVGMGLKAMKLHGMEEDVFNYWMGLRKSGAVFMIVLSLFVASYQSFAKYKPRVTVQSHTSYSQYRPEPQKIEKSGGSITDPAPSAEKPDWRGRFDEKLETEAPEKQ